MFLTKHHSHSRKVLVGLRKQTGKDAALDFHQTWHLAFTTEQGWIHRNSFPQQNLCVFNVVYWPIPYYGECCGSIAVGFADLICWSSRRAGSFICPAVISTVDVDYVWTWVGKTEMRFCQRSKRLQLMCQQQGCLIGTGLKSTAPVREIHRSEL